MALTPADLAVVDKELWTADVTTAAGDAMFTVDATFRDGEAGFRPPGLSPPRWCSMTTSRSRALARATTDASGHAQFRFEPSVIAMGSGNRFLHVTAGPVYPLVEKIVALP